MKSFRVSVAAGSRRKMSGRVVQKETQLERGTGPKEANVRFQRRLNFSLKKGPRTGLKNVWWGVGVP